MDYWDIIVFYLITRILIPHENLNNSYNKKHWIINSPEGKLFWVTVLKSYVKLNLFTLQVICMENSVIYLWFFTRSVSQCDPCYTQIYDHRILASCSTITVLFASYLAIAENLVEKVWTAIVLCIALSLNLLLLLRIQN